MSKPNLDNIVSSATFDQSHIRRIGFEARRFAAQTAIHHDDRFPTIHGITMHQFEDAATRRMILELQAKIASRKFDYKCVRYPDGVWQFVKHNISKSSWMMYKFVRDWLKNHPVRYIEVKMEANAYNPTIAIPDHDTFVEIVMDARYRQ